MSMYDYTGKAVLDDKYVYMAKKRIDPSDRTTNNTSQFAVFVHITDLHGDAERLTHALDFADKIGATAVIHTGDAVAYYSTDDFSYCVNAVGNHETKFLNVIGNHDVHSYNSASTIADKFITPFVTSQGYNLGATGESYYYVDFATYGLRFIALNQYQKYDKSMSVKYLQAQIQWLESTLNSVPSGYGVIIGMHIPEAGLAKSNDYPTFWQTKMTKETTTKYIAQVVDAYISKTTASVTFADFTEAVDFTSANGEFVAYVCGHNHEDLIGYMNTTNKQLVLDNVCTCAWVNRNKDGSAGTGYPYYTECSDLARVIGTACEDAFNVYVINTTDKLVNVIRIGADVTFDMKERKYMSIPYAD